MKRLTGPDALFLTLETSAWHQHIAGLTVLDPSEAEGFGYEEAARTIEERLLLAPKFTWKLKAVPFDLDRPVWIGGGTEIYREALPLASKLLLTVVHTSPPGDTYFPAEWEAHFPTETSRRHASDDNYSYSFLELAP